MTNDELTGLLRNLQGTGPVPASSLLSHLPSLIPAGAEETPRAHSVASTAARTLGSGLTLLPVVGSILRLFGVGKGKPEPPPLEKFTLPAAIRAEAGLSRNGDSYLIDRGAGDQIRTLSPAPAPAPTASRTRGYNSLAPSNAGPEAALEPEPASPVSGPMITVNVQAMDSQSFLDRREDIARAVREAMLQSHSLNDIVAEL